FWGGTGSAPAASIRPYGSGRALGKARRGDVPAIGELLETRLVINVSQSGFGGSCSRRQPSGDRSSSTVRRLVKERSLATNCSRARGRSGSPSGMGQRRTVPSAPADT